MTLPNITPQKHRGFTLIELLVVITIISVLAVVVFVALDPAKRIRAAKDARRTQDVQGLLTAVHQSVADNKGQYPTNMPAVGVEAMIGTGTAAQCSPVATNGCTVVASTACVDLATGTRNLSNYLKTMPVDPNTTVYSDINTGYSIKLEATGIVTVRSCGKEVTTDPDIYSSR